MGRRRFGRAALLTAGIWVVPSVIGLDRAAAAVPSAPYVPFYAEDFQGAIGGPNANWSAVITDVAPADPSRRFLGRFNDAVTLSLCDLVHTDPTATITFQAFGLQGINDESWGLDNVMISTV